MSVSFAYLIPKGSGTIFRKQGRSAHSRRIRVQYSYRYFPSVHFDQLTAFESEISRDSAQTLPSHPLNEEISHSFFCQIAHYLKTPDGLDRRLILHQRRKPNLFPLEMRILAMRSSKILSFNGVRQSSCHRRKGLMPVILLDHILKGHILSPFTVTPFTLASKSFFLTDRGNTLPWDEFTATSKGALKHPWSCMLS